MNSVPSEKGATLVGKSRVVPPNNIPFASNAIASSPPEIGKPGANSYGPRKITLQ